MVLFLFVGLMLLTFVYGSTDEVIFDESIYDELIWKIDNEIKYLSIQVQNGVKFEPLSSRETVNQVITWPNSAIPMYRDSTKSQPPKPVGRTTKSQPEKSVDVGLTRQHHPVPLFRGYTESLRPKPVVHTTGSRSEKSVDVDFTWQHQPVPLSRGYTKSLPPIPIARTTGYMF